MESPRESQGQNLRGRRPQGLWLRDFPRDSIHHDTPKAFPQMSLFCNPGPVKRDFLHCHQTQPAPRDHHTQYYIGEVHKFVELNPNILVWHAERMNQLNTGYIPTDVAGRIKSKTILQIFSCRIIEVLKKNG